jgi:hypothetical protein
MKKSELNQNIHLSEGNIKSKNTDDVLFLTWSLPCKITCPYATEMCKKRCFAQKNQYFKRVLASRMRNLEETKKDSFIKDMINWLDYYLGSKKATGKRIFVRIHTSGDFYNYDYLLKWIEIANYYRDNKQILFQAYTKSMPLLYKYFYPEDSCEEYDNWYGDWNENTSIIHAKETLKNINIHFVWSVWNDTFKDYTTFAKGIGLQTFTALPKEEIKQAVSNGAFMCNGDCGKCKECYTGTSKSIVIPYH